MVRARGPTWSRCAGLTNLDDYLVSHDGMSPADLLAIGDLDGDGQLTNRDIQPLLNRLAQDEMSGSGSASSEKASQSPPSQNSAASEFAIDRSAKDVALVSAPLADNNKAIGPANTKPSARPLPSLVNATLISTNTRPRIVGPVARFDLDQNRWVAAEQAGTVAAGTSLSGPRLLPTTSPTFQERLEDSVTHTSETHTSNVATHSAVSLLTMARWRTEQVKTEMGNRRSSCRCMGRFYARLAELGLRNTTACHSSFGSPISRR